MQSKIPLESEEADTLMSYLRQRGLRYTHVKNETGRPDASGKVRNWKAIWDKKDGVSPGFPDFVIALPGVGVAYIELKRIKNSKTSDEQLEWVDELNLCPGAEARVCKGWREAVSFLEELSPSKYGAALLADITTF